MWTVQNLIVPIYQFNMQLLVLKVRCMLEALNTQHQSCS